MKKQSFNTLKLITFFALVITMAMPAMAATCGPDSCSGTIARVYVTNVSNPLGLSTPTVYVSMVGGSQGLDCSLASGVYFTLPSNQLGYEQQYSLLLQAKTTNTPVIIRANAYSGGCTINYVVAGQ
jgi:hypothetical protein